MLYWSSLLLSSSPSSSSLADQLGPYPPLYCALWAYLPVAVRARVRNLALRGHDEEKGGNFTNA